MLCPNDYWFPRKNPLTTSLNILNSNGSLISFLKGEIKIAQEVGVKPDNVVFANAVKLPSHISHAAEKGVSLMSFDSHEELVKIKECYPTARLVLMEKGSYATQNNHQKQQLISYTICIELE